MKTTLKTLIIFAFVLLSFIAQAHEERAVGNVIFTIGNATTTADGVSSIQIAKGQALHIGQVIRTGQNGHVHIRFNDQAFVSVRPNSTLVIEDYLVDDRHPQNNRIKFTLKQGTSRLITGKGGHANKEAFRLNTPVAAIGVRGTDFVVQTDNSITRVSVQQGGVAVAPLVGECGVQSLGPCKGDLVRDLAGSLTGNYLEVRGQMAAELMTPTTGKQPFALPRPEEPAVSRRAEVSNGLANLGSNSTFMWGRWAGSTATPTGYELIGQNEAFTLFRLSEQIVLPTQGQSVQFNLTDAVVYGRRDGGEFIPAYITDAKFAVNFERREFATRFNWVFENKIRELYAKGSVSEDGRLLDEADRSNMSLAGALSNNGDNAAYVFTKRFNSEDLRAYGILRWAK